MDRKPKNLCKIQNSADGYEWVMLQLKLVKKAEDSDAHLGALGSDSACLTNGTQDALYLLWKWAGMYTPRVVCADSYFSYVSTCDALNENS